jgi:8-amino-7-oxononanoate synthase
MDYILDCLNDIKAAGLYRTIYAIAEREGSHIQIGERELVSFASNDYLGLARRPEVVEAAVAAARKYGAGACASRLIQGNFSFHEELEEKIARFINAPAALLFPTGYMANLGVISSLIEDDDVIVSDQFNHASIVDGCRLTGATVSVYPHADLAQIEQALDEYALAPKRLLITESLFSMDGDVAPLREIVKLAKERGALTMVDDAHGVGVLGENGRGGLELAGVEGRVDFLVGTLSKALGGLGGFAAGSREFVDLLRNSARSFIYTTALPATVCAAASAAIDLAQKDSSPRARLWDNVRHFKKALRDAGIKPLYEETQIMPVVIGSNDDAVAASAQLFERGFFVPAMRPPTVPEGSARFRIAITAMHSHDEIDAFVKALCEIKTIERRA